MIGKRGRRIAWLRATGLAIAGLGCSPALAQPPGDLSGTWTNAWYTWLERPKDFKTLVVSPAEAEAYEAPRRALNGELVSVHDTVGQAESEFPDNGPGLARIRGEIRSSWIVEPANGKIPWTAEARARIFPDHAAKTEYDGPEHRPTDERCLTAPGAAAPMINSHDANVLQFVQTPDALAIVSEKNHDLRVITLDGAALRPGEVARGAWFGVSRGRWEGKTLVAETTGLRGGITKLGDELYLSDKARVTERLTRTGPAEITYSFEVEDPTLFTQAWRGEMVLRPSEGLIYEYACHEGNYSLPSILSAARQKEAEAKR